MKEIQHALLKSMNRRKIASVIVVVVIITAAYNPAVKM
jgi:hypothetical protein